jgi:FkbM family methyltransferase
MFLNPFRPRPKPRVSYAQSGEDMIISFIFNAIGVQHPFYVDIGAHHPYHLSNTAFFYERGAWGINLEPDPDLFKAFRRYRKRDINLNLGVSDRQGKANFYLMSPSTLNTFTKEEAERIAQEKGGRIRKVKELPIDTLPGILARYGRGRNIDFLSIDAEGMDQTILSSINYTTMAPTVICVETLSYSVIGKASKATETIHFLQSCGYMIYADTYINTIFVRRDRWTWS